jgi:hypothetical protein
MADICTILGCTHVTFAVKRSAENGRDAVTGAEFNAAASHLCDDHHDEWKHSPENARLDPTEPDEEYAIEVGRFIERKSAAFGKTEEPPAGQFSCDYCKVAFTALENTAPAAKAQLKKHLPTCPWANYYRKQQAAHERTKRRTS